MPQYELMYLLGSNVADNEVPAVTEQVQKFIADFGGTDIQEQNLGKKKLAYPIGKTRNGTYVVVNFTMDGKTVNGFEAKIRTQENTIIRYLLVNLDEHLERQKKDQVQQASLTHKPGTNQEKAEETPAPKPPRRTEKAQEKLEEPTEAAKPAPVLEEINEEDLDKRIEAALSEDLTK